MADINWSALSQPQPEAKAIGTIPMSTTSVNLGDPAKEYQDYKTGQLQQQQLGQTIQSNAMKLQQQKQDMTDEATLRAAYTKGDQAYQQTLLQTSGPMAVEAYKQTKLQTQKAVSDVAKNDQDLAKGSMDAYTASAVLHATAAKTAADQQSFVTKQTLQKAGVQVDPRTGQQFMIDPKTQQRVPVPQQLIQKAQQQGQAAGQAAWNMGQQNMTPTQQQILKDNNLTQWNENVGHAMQLEGINAIAGYQAKKSSENGSDDTPLMKNVEYISGLKQDAANNVPGAAEKLQIAQNQGKSTGKEPSLLLSPSGQKAFTDNTALAGKVNDSLNTLNMLNAQFASMDKAMMNPMTGEAAAKFSQQGQAVQANLSQLVLQAPALLGLPGSALRIGSLWKVIQQTKPNMQQWMPAAKAISADLQYMGALKTEGIWQQQAEQMNALKKSNPDEANQWFAAHPDPIKTYPKPDLSAVYKLFPEAQNMGLEKDWDNVKPTEPSTGEAPVQSQVQPQSAVTPVNPLAQQAQPPQPIGTPAPQGQGPQNQGVPNGGTRVLNGVTYIKQADGWHSS